MHEILFPSPFGTPPSPELVARARLAPVPAGFTGRAGVLVFEDEAGLVRCGRRRPRLVDPQGGGALARDVEGRGARAHARRRTRREVYGEGLSQGDVRALPRSARNAGRARARGQKGGLAHGGDGCAHEPRRGARCGTKRSRRPGADLGEREDHRACRMVVRPDARARNTI